jgi:hypothetical protein
MWIGFFCYPCKVGPVGNAPSTGVLEPHGQRCDRCGRTMTAVWGPPPRPPRGRDEVPANVVPFRKAA